MLDRILETEVMDTPEEANDYDAMDHSQVNRVFVADFLQVWNGASPILDVGTGTAQIPIEFCRQSPRGEVIAVDLSVEMLKLAQRNIDRENFGQRIQVQLVNGREMPYPKGHFPAVMSNSILHHIPNPADCFAEIVRIASPEATIFIRDLSRPSSIAELDALVEKHAGEANARQKKLFRDSLHAALTVEEVRILVKEFGFDPMQVQQSSDRHWTWAKVS